MLRKQYRLNLRTERNRVTATGKTVSSSYFTVISAILPAKAAPAASGSRYAIIVSTKFHPHSVKRHYVKRLISQIIQENLAAIPPGYDFIIIPKKNLLTSDKANVSSDLLHLFLQIKNQSDNA